MRTTASLERRDAQIIGVVEDSYERRPRGIPRPRCYLPIDETRAGGFGLLVRSANPAALGPEVRRIVASVAPNLAPREIGTVAELLHRRQRSLFWLTDGLTGVSVVTLLLAAIGLFAVTSYAVAQRTNEFGVRLALGARPMTLAAGVLQESLAVTSIGTAIGLAAAVPVAKILNAGVMISISWLDPVSLAIVGGSLSVVGATAAWRPAWQVAHLDPIRALRQE